MNITECFNQIDSCEFECEGGPLRLNVGYILLKSNIAELEQQLAELESEKARLEARIMTQFLDGEYEATR
jgi:hypothetical protein